MTTLEEMVDTGCAAINGPYSRDGVRKVVLTVLEKHVGPMLEDAYAAGQEDGVGLDRPITTLLQEAYLQGITDAVDAMEHRNQQSPSAPPSEP